MNENLNHLALINRHPNIEWFCIIVIVTVLAAIILPSFPPFSGHPVRSDGGKSLMLIITRMQQRYYSIHGHFATSMQQLEREREFGELLSSRELEHIENNWEISIQIKDDIAFTYAVPKYISPNRNSYSYVAATTAYGSTDKNEWTICRTLEPSTAQPAAPILQESQQFLFWRHDAKLVCSSGTQLLIKSQISQTRSG